MTDVWNAFCDRLYDQNQFAIKLGLDNIQRALSTLGNPQLRHKRIIVGGTNGKGSTASLIGNLLQSAGLKVGFYSSPHLIELRERFRVQGKPLKQEQVLRVGRTVLEQFGEGSGNPLTFFELTTVMAVLLFTEAEVDVAIYEVGLGGRLDAVNAIEPDLTVLTSIDIDHTQYLGDTITQIAGEKAALLRESVPAVVAPQAHQEALDVILATKRDVSFAAPQPGFQGIRADHVGTAIAVVRAFGFPSDDPMPIIRASQWPGRQQQLTQTRAEGQTQWVVDAAHNPAGMRSFVDFLQTNAVQPQAFLIAAMKDKDLDALFGPLLVLGVPLYTFALKSARALEPEAMRSRYGVRVCANIDDAILQLSEFDVVGVCGSIYLLGELFDGLGQSADDMSTWRSQ